MRSSSLYGIIMVLFSMDSFVDLHDSMMIFRKKKIKIKENEEYVERN